MRALALCALLAGAGCLDSHRFDALPADASFADSDAGAASDAATDASTLPPQEAFGTIETLDDLVVGIGDDQAFMDPLDLNGSRPYHEAFLSAYDIQIGTVDLARYQLCANAGQCPFPGGTGDERSFAEAGAFCIWLGMRLPTEAEWEHAFRASVIGGGFEEFTVDVYDFNAYQSVAWANPRFDGGGGPRVIRGIGPPYTRTTQTSQPALFRCARTVQPMNNVPSEPTAPSCVTGCTVSQLVSGEAHVCALRANGDATCWGDGTAGQLGTGKTFSTGVPDFPVALDPISAIAAGDWHTCAISGGEVYCWGHNDVGQLGFGTTISNSTPTAIGLGSAVAIAAAGSHTCALLADGRLFCWGDAQGGSTASLAPLEVPGLTGSVKLAVGQFHICVANVADEVRCFGEVPAAGSYTTVASTSAQLTTGLGGDIVELVAGERHTCVLTEPPAGFEQALCWGDQPAFDPAMVTGVAVTPVLVSASARHVFASARATALADAAGNLDVLVMDPASVPVQTAGALGAGTLGDGRFGCVSGFVDTSVHCWGANENGQLGFGLIDNVPDTIPGTTSPP